MSLLISPSAFVYVVNVTDISPAPNKSYVSVLNTPGSGLELKVIRAIAWNNQISPTNGGEIGVLYQRIGDHVGGTSTFVLGIHPNNPGIQLVVTAKSGATVDLDDGNTGSTYFTHQLSTDSAHGIGDANGLTAIMLNAYANPLNYLATIGQPVTLNETTGLSIGQDATTVTAGKINAQIIFAAEMVI